MSLSDLAVIAHVSTHILHIASLALAAMHLIVHDSAHLGLLLVALAIAVELGILKLRAAELGQDLLPETPARFCHAVGLPSAWIQDFDAWPDIRGAQVLVILAHHIVHVGPPTRVPDLLSELIDLSVHVVLECV